MLLSVITLAFSAVASVQATKCYSGTVCSVSSGPTTSVVLVGKDVPRAVCATATYDCKKSSNPDCSKCKGGVLSDYMTPANAPTMANLKALVKRYGGELSLCNSDFCDVPKWMTPGSGQPDPILCYSGSACVTQDASKAFSNLKGKSVAHGTCASATYNCTKSSNPACKKCPKGVFSDYVTPANAATMANLKVTVKHYGGTLSTCKNNYCNVPKL